MSDKWTPLTRNYGPPNFRVYQLVALEGMIKSFRWRGMLSPGDAQNMQERVASNLEDARKDLKEYNELWSKKAERKNRKD